MCGTRTVALAQNSSLSHVSSSTLCHTQITADLEYYSKPPTTYRSTRTVALAQNSSLSHVSSSTLCHTQITADLELEYYSKPPTTYRSTRTAALAQNSDNSGPCLVLKPPTTYRSTRTVALAQNSGLPHVSSSTLCHTQITADLEYYSKPPTTYRSTRTVALAQNSGLPHVSSSTLCHTQITADLEYYSKPPTTYRSTRTVALAQNSSLSHVSSSTLCHTQITADLELVLLQTTNNIPKHTHSCTCTKQPSVTPDLEYYSKPPTTYRSTRTVALAQNSGLPREQFTLCHSIRGLVSAPDLEYYSKPPTTYRSTRTVALAQNSGLPHITADLEYYSKPPTTYRSTRTVALAQNSSLSHVSSSTLCHAQITADLELVLLQTTNNIPKHTHMVIKQKQPVTCTVLSEQPRPSAHLVMRARFIARFMLNDIVLAAGAKNLALREFSKLSYNCRAESGGFDYISMVMRSAHTGTL
ncbi:hypothetical protein J6590_016254 [Homalodisca vitripennis]|nr:hypothetical protein J6590_016254 [Homalodisca vitripennis]